jgi:putative transcriptional regulator
MMGNDVRANRDGMSRPRQVGRWRMGRASGPPKDPCMQGEPLSRAGRRLIESAHEALAYAEGRADLHRYGVHVPDEIDVRAIRQKVGMTQEGFARRFGEQRHRQPSGAARAFLKVIDREPEAVRRALTNA